VVELTRVRRSAEDYQAPACLSLLKEYQIGMMNSYLQALMALLSALQVQVNPLPGMTQEQYDQAYNAAVSQYYALAGQHLENAAGLKTKYELEKSRLLGVTPVPTPTTIIIAPQTPTP
jgi:hypothetical protein